MDLSSSDTDLRPNSSMADDCDFAIIQSPISVTDRSEEYAEPEEDFSTPGGFAADCRAVILSGRGLFLDGLREMLGKSRISVIGEAQNIPISSSPYGRGRFLNLSFVILHLAATPKPCRT